MGLIKVLFGEGEGYDVYFFRKFMEISETEKVYPRIFGEIVGDGRNKRRGNIRKCPALFFGHPDEVDKIGDA